MQQRRQPTQRLRGGTGLHASVTYHPWTRRQRDVGAWLGAQRSAMERELRRHGFPPTAWHEVELLPLAPGHLANPRETRLRLLGFRDAGNELHEAVKREHMRGLIERVEPRSEVSDRVRQQLTLDSYNTRQGYWAAAVARVCTEALEAKNAQRQFLLGVLLERCERYRREPQSAEALAVFQAAPLASKSKGGRVPKRRPGIWQRVCELVKATPKIKANEAWRSVSKATGIDEGLIYRDGDKLVERNDRTGCDRAITRRTFDKYVTWARREMRSK